MVHAIRVHKPGGVDALVWEPIEVGEPGAGEVLVRHTAIGLNYIDVYFRTGSYPAAEFPFIPGFEAAGVVEAVGSEVTEFEPGERVAYASRPIGAYAEQRIISADRLVKVPDSIDDRSAAAMMLKGMTAHYLLRRTYNVKPGDTILFHAAAGGVGLIACQWAKHLGATVIGTVGSADKAELVAAHGCDYPIVYTQADFVERVRDITKGQGVPVVYDSVGKDTFAKSIKCLRKFGLLVSFGQSSGKIPPFDPGALSAHGSLYLTRPTLFDYIEARADLVASAKELFETVRSGGVRIEVKQTYPLQEAARAHADLEGRLTRGASVLLP